METTVQGHGVAVGTIFDCHWGYDQSNVDWYEVVGVTKTGVQIREVATTMADDGRQVLPVAGKYIGAKRHRKVKVYESACRGCDECLATPGAHGRSVWINLTSYSGASPWDGHAKYDTTAAGEMGH